MKVFSLIYITNFLNCYIYIYVYIIEPVCKISVVNKKFTEWKLFLINFIFLVLVFICVSLSTYSSYGHMFLFNWVEMSCPYIFIAWKALMYKIKYCIYLLYKRKYCNKIVLEFGNIIGRQSQKEWERTKDKLLWQFDSERKRRLGCPWFYKWNFGALQKSG